MSRILEFEHATKGVVRVLEFGDKKYSRGDWKKGRSYVETMDSLMRHMNAFFNGEDRDPETGEPHVDHISVNALMLAEYFHTLPEFDDRILEEVIKNARR